MKRISAASALVVVLSIPLVARANIALPRETWTEISMVSEHVKIALSPAKVTVEATFEMKNTGDAVTAVVGYPRGVLEKSLDDFSVTVDGKEAELRKQSSRDGGAILNLVETPKRYQFEGGYPEWKIFEVYFESDQTRKIVVRYHVAPAELKSADGRELLAYIYTLKTGATWKGNIEKAVIEMTLDGISPADLNTVTPEKCERDGAKLTWTFKDFKPTQDIELTFRKAE